MATRWFLAGLLAALLPAGCGEAAPTSPHVVVLLLDTVRADHLGCYGHHRPTTPAIDGLAARGTRWAHALSNASWTLPAVATLFTGTRPATHGAGLPLPPDRQLRLHEAPPIRGPAGELPLLTELLAARGYDSALYSSNAFVRAEDFGRGAGRFELRSKAPADEVVDFGLARLDEWAGGERPFFLYLHFMDAHIPLEPPEPYLNMFQHEGRENGDYLANWLFTDAGERSHPYFETFKAQKACVYDGAIRFIDDQVARLQQRLDAHGLRDDTVIVVVADHGEEFWEHAEVEEEFHPDPRGTYGTGHGHSLFHEVLAVPLVLAGPGVPAGLVVDTPVELVDVLPTLLDLLAIDLPRHLEGRPLLPPSRAAAPPLVAEGTAYGAARVAVLDPPWKYIHSHGERDVLYDLAADPGETNDLLAQRPEEARAFLEYARRRLLLQEEHARRATRELGGELLEDLEAVGYVDRGR